MKPQNKYAALLLSPLWQRKRLEILQRDNFTCTLCTDSRTTLHVHHTAYKGNPWDIPNDQLQTLCEHCHSISHELNGRKILAIHKRISLNARCWEIVAFLESDIVFLYLFFTTDKVEIITIFPHYNNAA